MRNLLNYFLILTIILLAACTANGPSTPTSKPVLEATNSITPTAAVTTFSLDDIGQISGHDLLLQLNYGPGLSEPHLYYPYGRTPVFTLLADGRVIYADESVTPSELKIAQLKPEEIIPLIQQVLDAGYERLESYTDNCQETTNGETLCVVDAGITSILLRLDPGKLREVQIYASFANDPQAFESILHLLDSYTHPNALPYHPEKAALFFYNIEADPQAEPFPLDESFTPPDEWVNGLWAVTLQGKDLDKWIQYSEKNPGVDVFKWGNSTVRTILVPWMPGDNFDELQSDFPLQEPQIQVSKTLDTCLPPPMDESETGIVRLVFLKDGDLFLQDGNQRPNQVTTTGNISSFVLSSDGTLALTLLETEAGPEIWSVDLSRAETFPIAQGYPPEQSIELLQLSDDHTWIAFSVFLEDGGGELWAAKTNGKSTKRLFSEEALIALQPELPDAPAVPTSTQWIPNTHLLSFDGFPVVEGIYVYIPDSNQIINVDSGIQQPYLPGVPVYSPDGTRAAFQQINQLVLANADGSQPLAARVYYFALGMGEWYLYPSVSWSQDGKELLTVLPDSPEVNWDIFGETPQTIWRVPSSGEQAQSVGTITGSPFGVIFSPGSTYISYYSSPQGSNIRTLEIATADGSQKARYDSQQMAQVQAWSPDERYFLYSYGETPDSVTLMLGSPCLPPTEVMTAPEPLVRWLDQSQFIIETTDYGTQITTLYLGGIDQNLEILTGIPWTDFPQWDAVLVP